MTSTPLKESTAVLTSFTGPVEHLMPGNTPTADTRLQPATVVAMDNRQPILDLGYCHVRAEMALGIDYDPEIGDQLLTIGQGGDWWVIGIISGTGRKSLTSMGDISIQSMAGSIQIAAQENVQIRTRRLTFLVDSLHRIAEVAYDTFGKFFHRVKHLRSVHAGQGDTKVDGANVVHAERIIERAEKETKISGSTLHLG